jgi:hypothetical protein
VNWRLQRRYIGGHKDGTLEVSIKYKRGTNAVQTRYKHGTNAVQMRYKRGTNTVQGTEEVTIGCKGSYIRSEKQLKKLLCMRHN